MWILNIISEDLYEYDDFLVIQNKISIKFDGIAKNLMTYIYVLFY